MGGGFLALLGLKSPILLFRPLISKLYPSIKLFFPPDFSFSIDFFFKFLSSTCYDVWLLIGFFFVGDSKNNDV